MKQCHHKDFNETRAVFYDESPGFEGDMNYTLMVLHRAEKTLRRIAENHCNGHPRQTTEFRDGKMYWYDVENLEWLARDLKTELRLKKKVAAIADSLGFGVQFNGDPRGFIICFLLPSGKCNSWAGKTWGLLW